MDTVTVAQAKAHLSRVIDRVQAGSEITITRRGRPVATLQPVIKAKRAIDLTRIDAVRRQLPAAKRSALETIRAVRNERA